MAVIIFRTFWGDLELPEQQQSIRISHHRVSGSGIQDYDSLETLAMSSRPASFSTLFLERHRNSNRQRPRRCCSRNADYVGVRPLFVASRFKRGSYESPPAPGTPCVGRPILRRRSAVGNRRRAKTLDEDRRFAYQEIQFHTTTLWIWRRDDCNTVRTPRGDVQHSRVLPCVPVPMHAAVLSREDC